jgi:Pyridine nucleotide-disulphide oxidoreductase, dimerisation domain
VVAAAVRGAFRASGMPVREEFGAIELFERTPVRARMNFSKDGRRESAEAALAVVAASWVGCHVVGERTVEIAQVAAIAMAAGMPVNERARVAVSFPTYAEILFRAAVDVAAQLGLSLSWQAHQVRTSFVGGAALGGNVTVTATGAKG